MSAVLAIVLTVFLVAVDGAPVAPALKMEKSPARRQLLSDLTWDINDNWSLGTSGLDYNNNNFNFNLSPTYGGSFPFVNGAQATLTWQFRQALKELWLEKMLETQSESDAAKTGSEKSLTRRQLLSDLTWDINDNWSLGTSGLDYNNNNFNFNLSPTYGGSFPFVNGAQATLTWQFRQALKELWLEKMLEE
ncbi:uncharacterized protein LOC144861321 [Branchiostoma floridae x Branchiostoma japonicum]